MIDKWSKINKCFVYPFVLLIFAVWYNFEGIAEPHTNYYCANTTSFPCSVTSCTWTPGAGCYSFGENPNCDSVELFVCKSKEHIFGVWPMCFFNGNPNSSCDPVKSYITCSVEFWGYIHCSPNPQGGCLESCNCSEWGDSYLVGACV